MLCPTAPALLWVAWASLLHLHQYYAPLRLPPCPSRVASLGARFPIPCRLLWFVVSPRGSWSGRSAPTAPGLLVTRSPTPGMGSRRQVALPRSRVPPMQTCPALRPRWCPAHSPKRTQDGGLPATGNRRLPTTIHFSGLHHAACLLAPPGFVRPLAGRHAGSLLTGWLSFNQVGLEPYWPAPTGKQQPISWAYAQFQGFGLTLARPGPCSARSRDTSMTPARRLPPDRVPRLKGHHREVRLEA